MDAGCEPLGVVARDLLTRAAVHQYGMRQVVQTHVLDKARDVRLALAPLVLSAPVTAHDVGIGQQHALRADDAAHPQIEAELAAQVRALRGELIEQHAPDRARADHTGRQRIR